MLASGQPAQGGANYLMEQDTTKNRKGSKRHWAKWELSFSTRETAEIIGMALHKLGYKTSMPAIFDNEPEWIVQTAAPKKELQQLGFRFA